MYAICYTFLGLLFRQFTGPDALDFINIPFGLDLPVGGEYGSGIVVMHEGLKMLAFPLWRRYLAGSILLGVVTMYRNGSGVGLFNERQ